MSNTQDPIQDLVLKALDRAFVMGQNYWADADSESWTANKRSDVTREKFREMRDEVCAALQPAAAQPQGDAREAVYRAMPYEPTEPMRWAGKAVDPGLTHEQLRAIWSVMWSAAPQPTSTQASEPSARMSDENRLVAYSAAATLRAIGYEWDDATKKWQAAPARASEPNTVVSFDSTAALIDDLYDKTPAQASEPSAVHIPAKPATEADMQVYQGIANNYMAPAPARAVEPLLENMPTNWELSWGSEDEESPGQWRVHVREGSRNDREWRLIGSGPTPSAALARAHGITTTPAAKAGKDGGA